MTSLPDPRGWSSLSVALPWTTGANPRETVPFSRNWTSPSLTGTPFAVTTDVSTTVPRPPSMIAPAAGDVSWADVATGPLVPVPGGVIEPVPGIETGPPTLTSVNGIVTNDWNPAEPGNPA